MILGVTGLWLGYEVWASAIYSQVMGTLVKGIQVTVAVTLVAYASACALGLSLAVAGLSRYVVLRQAARVWIEVIRGVPIMVLLLYVAFVISPALVFAWNWVASWLGATPITSRDFPLIARAVLALTLAYSAFLAEIFRAGLQAVDKGQIEAAATLGLSYWQTQRKIVLPQALRISIPNIVGIFIGLFKDTTLVLVVSIYDFLGIINAGLQDSKWAAPQTANTGYFVAAIVYFIFCYGMSRYALFTERRLAESGRR